jgi:hypothetical protein
MATRYGEGKEKAFERLDSKIKKANTAGSGDPVEKKKAIFSWLPPPDTVLIADIDAGRVEYALRNRFADPSTNYQKGLKLRQADTGLWFLESEQYAEWKASPSYFIWLHGIPVCGKTILSSTIIEDVLQRCMNNPGKATAHFYFDFKDLQKQASELMVKSLVTQLSQQCISISPLLESPFVPLTMGSGSHLLKLFWMPCGRCAKSF